MRLSLVWAMVLALLLLWLLLPGGGDAAEAQTGFTSTGRVSVVDVAWGAPDQPATAAPGDLGRPLTVWFLNQDETAFTSVRATLVEAEGLNATDGGPLVSIRAGGPLPAGGLWPAQFVVDVAPGLDPHAPVPLTLRFAYREAGKLADFELTMQGEVALTGAAALRVLPAVDVLAPSERAALPIVVRNEGSGPAGGVVLVLEPSPGAALLPVAGDNRWELGRLGPGEERAVEARLLTPSGAGAQQLVARLTYTDPAGTPVQDARTLAFHVAEPPPGPLRVKLLSEATLTAARAADLRFRVTNPDTDADGETVQGLTATLALPGGGPGMGGSGGPGAPPLVALDGTGQRTLGELPPGASQEFGARILVSRTAADTYPVGLTLSWQDAEGFAHQQETSFGMLVLGAVDFQLTDLTGRANARTGEVRLAGTITNVGTVPANNLRAGIEGPTPLLPLSPEPVGDLDPNSPLPFETATTVLPGAGMDALRERADRFASLPLTMRLVWTDEYGLRREASVQGDVRMQVVGAPPPAAGEAATEATAQAPPPPEPVLPDLGLQLLLLAVGVLAAVLLGSLLLPRRRRARMEPGRGEATPAPAPASGPPPQAPPPRTPKGLRVVRSSAQRRGSGGA